MHYVIPFPSLIQENLSKAYLLDLLEHFRISRHGRYRLLLIHIRSDQVTYEYLGSRTKDPTDVFPHRYYTLHLQLSQ